MRQGVVLICSLAILSSSCGSPANSISGTVTYQGTPLNFGRIYFTINRGEAVRSARIEPDGSYSVEGIPVGETQIAVVVPPVHQAVPDDPAAPTFGGRVPTDVDRVMIPKRYSEVSTSGLKLTVTHGPQTHDIDLD